MAAEYGMFIGDLSDLPHEDSNIVRIFTSSTFTDMFEERNYLMKNIYPLLRHVCMELGLEFEVVDMRWGVSDKLSADHKTTDLCLREISNCQRLSHGPNFITFLGDKYGYRPFPSSIPEDEFDILLSVISKENDGANLLHRWFKKDSNNIPPNYILQPIDSILSDYNNNIDQSKQSDDRKKWWKTFEKMQTLFGGAAQKAFEKNLLTEEQSEKYLISVTENEVKKGIFQSANPSKQCACFVRVLQDVDSTTTALDDESIKLYFDTDAVGSMDKTSYARQRLDALRKEKVKKFIHKLNFKQFNVCWKSGGIDPSFTEHRKYLKEFGESVKAVLLNLIHDFADIRLREGLMNRTMLFTEVLHHSLFCLKKTESFYGRENLLSNLQSTLQAKVNNPKKDIFAIHGLSGSGKTSVMAMLAKNAKTWLNEPNLAVIYRFLGTSPNSSNIEEVIHSLCDQICEIYQLEKPSKKTMNDFNDMVQFFHQILGNIESPLLIILDSIDQLSNSRKVFDLDWLPRQLNEYVTIVVSTLPTHQNILQKLKQLNTSADNFFEVGVLQSNSTKIILKNYFSSINRKLTANQEDYIASCCELCPQPIYLKLAFDEALHWKSYDQLTNVSLPVTTSAIIESLFQKIEIEFGEILVSHALGYITASKSGLSENELEDILSLDDTVLSDVHEYWDPPIKGMVRLPPLLWKRIRYQLDTYLTERKADGSIVINWYHRQFHEAAVQRYLNNAEKVKYLYENLSDFFLGVYSNKNGKSINLHKRNKIIPNADRQVQQQPLKYQKDIYNFRKLNELPRILLKVANQNSLFQHVIFNFEWIESKIKAFSVNHVLQDMKAFLLNDPENEEVKTLFDTIILSSSNIEVNKDEIANQLFGRLTGFEKSGFKNIEKLLSEAKKSLECLDKPTFLVRSSCMIPAGGPLQTTLQGQRGLVNKVIFLNENALVCGCFSENRFNVHIWSISDRKKLKVFDFPSNDKPLMKFHKETKTIIVLTNEIYSINVDILSIVSSRRIELGNYAALNKDGTIVAMVYEKGIVKVIHNHTGREFNIPDITCLAFLPSNILIASSESHPVMVSIDSQSNEVIHFESEQKPQKRSSMLLPMFDETHLVTSIGLSINVWNINTHSHVWFLRGHKETINCLERINDDMFASGSQDSFIKIWSIRQQKLLHTLKGHQDGVMCLKVNPASTMLVSGSKDDKVNFWNLDNNHLEGQLIGHSSWIAAVDISANLLIASGSNDKTVKIWNIDKSLRKINQPQFTFHSKECNGVAISNDGKFAASISKNDRFLLWNVQKMVIVKDTELNPTCVAFSNDSSMLLAGTDSGEVNVYDITKDSCNISFTNISHKKATVALNVMKHDEFVITAGADGTVTVLHMKTHQEIQRLEHHKGPISCIHLSNDNRILATGGSDKVVNVFKVDVDLLSHMHKFNIHEKSISSLETTADNKHLASGDRCGVVIIWCLDTGENLYKIQVGNDTVTELIHLKGMSYIVSTHTFEHQLSIIYPDVECQTVDFTGHTHAVMCIRLTKDKKYLVSSSRDCSLKLWDTNTMEMVDTLNIGAQIKFFDMAISNNGNYNIVAVTKTGSVAFVRLLLPCVHDINLNGTLILMNDENSPLLGSLTDNLVAVESKKCCGRCDIL